MIRNLIAALAALTLFAFAAPASAGSALDALSKPYTGAEGRSTCEEEIAHVVSTDDADYITVPVLLDLDGLNQDNASGFFRFEIGMDPEAARKDENAYVTDVFACTYPSGVVVTEIRLGGYVAKMDDGAAFLVSQAPFPKDIVETKPRAVTQLDPANVNSRYAGYWVMHEESGNQALIFHKK